MGYLLRPGFTLPPLMFTREEIEVLVLGSRWVASRGDEGLTRTAQTGLAKIRDVLTPGLRTESELTTLVVVPSAQPVVDPVFAKAVRAALRDERKLLLDYIDENGARTSRKVWPFGLGFFDHAQVLFAWCELRDGFCAFRMDRIATCATTGERTPESRRTLLARWMESEKIAPDAFDFRD